MKNVKRILKDLMLAVALLALVGCKDANVNTGIQEQAEVESKETDREQNQMQDQEQSQNSNQDQNQEETMTDADSEEAKTKPVTIVYTNDVHSYIDNVVTDENGNVTGDGLRFSKIAAMVADMRDSGENVVLVDAGDEIQGDVYGALDEGATIIDLMNATGYQLATPGNHDFDYGVISLLKLAENANFKYVTCNFHPTRTKEIIFSESEILDCDGVKVAFIGVTTPETITSATPVYFQDENGEFIYTVEGMSNPNDMYLSVQNAIDNVKDKADYVVCIGHVGVGVDEKKNNISSEDIIANVSGLDAFIDGHSHTVMEGEIVKDKDGKDVILTQTGNYLENIGVMTINPDGSVETKLVQDYEREDEKVAELEKKWIESVNDQLSEEIGVLDTTLYIGNPDNNQERWIRAKDMNAGDFSADSIYWYFNDKLDINCDVAVVNGGAIRAQIDSGSVSYLSAKSIMPFGNMICLISATGQQIVDALEMGSTVIGLWDDEWNTPQENGGFMQVAGLSYTVDGNVESSVKTDSNGMFVSVDGEYKVKDVKVYNKETGEYEPIEPDKEYQLGGINYILRNGGNGLSMFDNDELTVDYVGQDYLIFAEYVKSFAKDGDYARVNTQNSPLSAYKGYLIDYENPLGSGRITIENGNYKE